MASQGPVWDPESVAALGRDGWTILDSAGRLTPRSVPNVHYLLPVPEDEENHESTVVYHGDDFLAEGHEEQLRGLDELLAENFEVTRGPMIGPGSPGHTRYLKRLVGYTDSLPGGGEPGFFWVCSG